MFHDDAARDRLLALLPAEMRLAAWFSSTDLTHADETGVTLHVTDRWVNTEEYEVSVGGRFVTRTRGSAELTIEMHWKGAPILRMTRICGQTDNISATGPMTFWYRADWSKTPPVALSTSEQTAFDVALAVARSNVAASLSALQTALCRDLASETATGSLQGQAEAVSGAKALWSTAIGVITPHAVLMSDLIRALVSGPDAILDQASIVAALRDRAAKPHPGSSVLTDLAESSTFRVTQLAQAQRGYLTQLQAAGIWDRPDDLAVASAKLAAIAIGRSVDDRPAAVPRPVGLAPFDPAAHYRILTPGGTRALSPGAAGGNALVFQPTAPDSPVWQVKSLADGSCQMVLPGSPGGGVPSTALTVADGELALAPAADAGRADGDAQRWLIVYAGRSLARIVHLVTGMTLTDFGDYLPGMPPPPGADEAGLLDYIGNDKQHFLIALVP